MRTVIRITFKDGHQLIADIDKFEMLTDREVVTLFSAIYPGWSSFQILNEETLGATKGAT
jgi:hypothetical protein